MTIRHGDYQLMHPDDHYHDTYLFSGVERVFEQGPPHKPPRRYVSYITLTDYRTNPKSGEKGGCESFFVTTLN